MLTGDELFHVAHDDRSGRARLHPRVAGLGLAAALLGELVLDGRVEVHGDGLEIVRRDPPVDPLAHATLAQLLAQPHHHDVRVWLAFLGATAIESVAQRLVVAGQLRRVVHGRWRRRVYYLPENAERAAGVEVRLARLLTAPPPRPHPGRLALTTPGAASDVDGLPPAPGAGSRSPGLGATARPASPDAAQRPGDAPTPRPGRRIASADDRPGAGIGQDVRPQPRRSPPDEDPAGTRLVQAAARSDGGRPGSRITTRVMPPEDGPSRTWLAPHAAQAPVHGQGPPAPRPVRHSDGPYAAEPPPLAEADAFLAGLVAVTGLARHVLWQPDTHDLGMARIAASVAALRPSLFHLLAFTEAAVGDAVLAPR
ncbi:hypothetical protein Val02_44500 [Virgisporangium aliadipatigenens]|uniref:GPP34 family phosphoprotein n=1 Tax=Virgisporangium aliadipatigenens TaxID=741659 RepID=A0A8J3YLA4_9ACTN|nr:GPP34 family phosphoprotein [Virgisporangium aliadipatigenens]GIJ47564.1 hypothetical protein Val02_44500 [Virgisporangium aliadipatigenens]